jgi:hypothetical protein
LKISEALVLIFSASTEIQCLSASVPEALRH